MQTIPAGVANADYQCLDFDNGMPPSNVWVPTVQGGGILELVTDQVQSVPNALHARSVLTDSTDPLALEPVGQLLWSASGGLSAALSITADIYPLQLHGGEKSRADYLCLKIGAVKACLSYDEPRSDLAPMSLTIPEGTSGPGVAYPFCPVEDPALDLPVAQWTRIFLRLTNMGVLSLSKGNATMSCSANMTLSSGATSVQIGAHGVKPSTNYGDVHLDNVVTYVER
jgi:hypothetical protein